MRATADLKVAIINESTVLSDSQVASVVPDLQTQVHRDFNSAWGIDADLSFVPQGGTPDGGAWWLAVLDDSDQAGALGYHDVTNEGLPLGKVFAGSDLKLGNSWTVTVSHELLEMLADPEVNLTVFVQPTADAGTLYAYEVCDACEGDQFGYKIGQTLLSDFVYPAWFESFQSEGDTQFDFGKYITKPFSLLADGYIGVLNVTTGSGWQQLTAEKGRYKYEARPRVGSRRERRRTPRDQWLASRVMFGSQRR